ncbi:MAG: hypothetical protein KDI44_19510 [Thiothrix sp.]|nr:hypothetical protein [Thiothrix sp.]HPQ97384.1 hypothetical protein [Thiolinea sp.]
MLQADSPAVLRHIDLYQDLIRRMASNSAECKKWATGMVTAILILVAEKGIGQAAALVAVPVILFCFLDAYYLALEKQFIAASNCFLDQLHNGELTPGELFRVRVTGSLPRSFLDALLSWSVWPFYLGMLALVVFARSWIPG